MEQKIIKIIIADDHSFLRMGLKKTIGDETDMKVTGEASTANEALELLKNTQPDIAIVDISMPGKSGLDFLKDIKKMKIKTRVLILSMHPEDRFAVRALKSGAFGYLTKESAPEELVNAIRTVMTGRKYVSKILSDKLVDLLSGDSEKMLHEQLSDREYEVLIMLATGKKSSEIGDELSISIHTVNTYRARILEKMGLSSNVELTHYAMQNNLIE